MLKSLRIVVGAAALLLSGMVAANATPITIDYTLTPTSGGSVVGTMELVLSAAPTMTYTNYASLISAGSKVTFGSEVFNLTSSNVTTLGFTSLASNYALWLVQLGNIHDTNGAGWLTMTTGFNVTTAAGVSEAGTFSAGTVKAAATAVPEPLTLSIFGAGLFGTAAMRRRKKKA